MTGRGAHLETRGIEMTDRILIVEDEIDLLQSLRYSLEKEGFEVVTATTGAEGAKLSREKAPDLMVLDLMLPDMSGLDVCREVRKHDVTRELPIIMATARSDEIDRVVGFEVGADDYVVKPFSVRELGLRIRAVLRRRSPGAELDAHETINFGRLRLDADARQVFVDAEEKTVTALEFHLLETLLRRKGRVQTRETLLSDVWGVSPEVTTRTVDTHVKRLREKLGPAGTYIETVRGFGYRFKANPEAMA